MPIPALRAPRAFAGDKPGPFAPGTGRDLRILVDLPPRQRQVDDSTTTWDRLGVPDPSRFGRASARPGRSVVAPVSCRRRSAWWDAHGGQGVELPVQALFGGGPG